jgi:RNA polymerase sigma factor (sigma-70 family)
MNAQAVAARARSRVREDPHHKASENVELLYRDFWPELSGGLRRVFGPGPPDPEDAAQTAFSRYLSVPDPGRIESPRAFLWRSASNYILDQRRRARRHTNHARAVLAEQAGMRVEPAGPERLMLEAERFSLLEQAISAMAHKPRTVLTLYCFKGYTYQQIAASTGWSYGDVYRQMSAALGLLAKALR